MLAAFRVGALGNDCGRPQNGTASTGKLNYSNVRCGRASNRTEGRVDAPCGFSAGVASRSCCARPMPQRDAVTIVWHVYEYKLLLNLDRSNTTRAQDCTASRQRNSRTDRYAESISAPLLFAPRHASSISIWRARRHAPARMALRTGSSWELGTSLAQAERTW